MIKQRFAHHPKRKKEATSALRKLRVIAGRLVRELQRKLSKEALELYLEQLINCNKVISQKQQDANKMYSLHEPNTACIAKGKAHKKFEFGSKVSIAIVPTANIIVGVKNFNGNPNDTSTLEPALVNVEKITGIKFKNAIVDRGYKGKSLINGTNIISPKPPNQKQPYCKSVMRKKCRSRAAIEPIIGHVKQDCRMRINYLKGNIGNEMNANLAAAGFNFKGLLRKIKEAVLWPCFLIQIFFPFKKRIPNFELLRID